MSTFKFSLLWLLFSATYIGFSMLIGRSFPEMWLYHLLLKPGQDFIEEETWDTIFMSVLLLLALVVNLIFIFFSFAITRRIRQSVTSGAQHRSSVRMSALKFSSLWILFVVTYLGFVGLICSVFPVEKWLAYLLKNNYNQLIIEEKWDDIVVPTVLLSALAVNLVFIFLSLTIIQRLRNRKKRQLDCRC